MKSSITSMLAGTAFLLAMGVQSASADTVHWLNHLDLLSGNESDLIATHRSTSSGVGGGLTGKLFQSRTVGETFPAPDSGNKVAQVAIDIPPQPEGLNIRAVRVCYESSNSKSTYISQIRISRVNNPPSTATVLLDDGTDLNTATGPVCVNSRTTNIPIPASSNGPLLLDLRFFFGNTQDRIVIRGLGLVVG